MNNINNLIVQLVLYFFPNRRFLYAGYKRRLKWSGLYWSNVFLFVQGAKTLQTKSRSTVYLHRDWHVSETTSGLGTAILFSGVWECRQVSAMRPPENVGITLGILFLAVLQGELHLLPVWVTTMLCFRYRTMSASWIIFFAGVTETFAMIIMYCLCNVVVQLQNLHQRFTI